MLRFGPNGIPLSCKGRTWLDALYDVKELELEAIEFQLLRGIGEPIKDGELIKQTAEDLDIFVAVHAPYYMDLLGSEESAARSIDYLKWSGSVANEIGAKLVVTHVGFYGDLSHSKAIDRAVVMVRKVRDHFRKKKYTHLLGIEIHGKQDLFGGLEEILEVTHRVSGTVPVVNFAHLHARERGFFKKKEDFESVFEELFAADTPFVYTLFSGLEHDFEGNEVRFTPIKKGDLRFKPLAEFLLDHEDKEIIVISSSPLLEHDAQYMKVLLRRVEEKCIQKAAAQKIAEEKAAIEAKAAAKKKAEAEKKKTAEAEKKKAEAEKKKTAEAEKKKAEAEKKKIAEAEKKKKAEAEKKKVEAEKKKKAEAEKKKKVEAEKKKAETRTSTATKKPASKKPDTKKPGPGKSSEKKPDTKGSVAKSPTSKKPTDTKKSSSKKDADKKKAESKGSTTTKRSDTKGSDPRKSAAKEDPGKKGSDGKKAGSKTSSTRKNDSKRSSTKKSTPVKGSDAKKSETSKAGGKKKSGTEGSGSAKDTGSKKTTLKKG